MPDNKPDGLQHQTIPVVSEEATVSKQTVETGRVHIEKSVEYEEVTASDVLRREEIVVEHVTHGSAVDPNDIPVVRHEDGVTIIPVLEEILVVEKRLVLKEELHIKRVIRKESAEIPVTLKRENVTVSREPSDGREKE